MSSRYVRKTILLNQDYINKALKIFNVKTEKDAVNKALEIIAEENNIIDLHKELGNSTNIAEIYK